jgi:hypothetical protein
MKQPAIIPIPYAKSKTTSGKSHSDDEQDLVADTITRDGTSRSV